MQAVVDVDQKLLSLAEQRARQEGKSLEAFVEDALRAVLGSSPTVAASDKPAEIVDADDAFFAALEEIRALGRVPAPHRQASLS
jgi:hypothetical protein